MREAREPHTPVSPQSRSLFSASFQTFCLTARAYLNTQKYWLFCSLRHHWKGKERQIAIFESEWLKTSKDIAPQSREILQTFAWRRHKLAPYHKNLCKFYFATFRSYIFARLRRITFKFGDFTNLRRSFQWCRQIFPNWSMSKAEKNRGRVNLWGWIEMKKENVLDDSLNLIHLRNKVILV